MKKSGDFLKYHNDLDVIGLVEGIDKMQKDYSDQGLDMFKDAVSLPKLAQKQIFRSLKDDYFTTFSKKYSYIYLQRIERWYRWRAVHCLLPDSKTKESQG